MVVNCTSRRPHRRAISDNYRHTVDSVSPHCPTAIDKVRVSGNSCGGEVTCVVRAPPVGLGYPVFDKLEAELAKALMSLPATKARACSPCPAALCNVTRLRTAC